jgi:hypothetical protein
MVCSLALFAGGTHGLHVGMGVIPNRHVVINIVCHLVIAYLSFQLINAMSSSVKYGGSLMATIGGGLNSTGCSRMEFRDLTDSSYLAFQSTASWSAVGDEAPQLLASALQPRDVLSDVEPTQDRHL